MSRTLWPAACLWTGCASVDDLESDGDSDPTDSTDSTDDTDVFVERGPVEIQVDLGAGVWQPLQGARITQPLLAAIQLAAVDEDPLLDNITEVAWLWDDTFVRDREGPPWQPHPDSDVWRSGPRLDGTHELCAQAVHEDGVEEVCATWTVQLDEEPDPLPKPPAVVGTPVDVDVVPASFVGPCAGCDACETDLQLRFTKQVEGPISIEGYRHVVAVAGDIRMNGTEPANALHIQNTCGIIHIEGMKIDGDSILDGVRIDAPDARARLFNSHVDVRSSAENGAVDAVQVTAAAATHLHGVSALARSEGIDLSPGDGATLGALTLASIAIEGPGTGPLLRVRNATSIDVSEVYVWDTVASCEESLDLEPNDDPAWDLISCDEPPNSAGAQSKDVGLGYER
ncbi:MAG: hypothetical protein AB8H79_11950 [Myxococcota bacterium]